MSFVSFRLLSSSDAEYLTSLLLCSPLGYAKYFYPFDFSAPFIHNILKSAIKDKYFGIQLQDVGSGDSHLVGFYMLRGIDEGYQEPMYGVFISQEWNRKGIARLSLYHAECYCKLNSYKRLLLKVNPENHKALRLYQSCGFNAYRVDSKIGNLVLFKDL